MLGKMFPLLLVAAAQWRECVKTLSLCMCLCLLSHASLANELPDWALDIDEPETNLASDIEDLKQTLLNLNRDLLILEEELLFPADTQIAVFISLDVGKFFQLDSFKLEIDGKPVASHLYTERQVKALHLGGVQQVYMGNLKSGDHEITAFMQGEGPNGREYKRAATLNVEKTTDPLRLHVRIQDFVHKLQPDISIQPWLN